MTSNLNIIQTVNIHASSPYTHFLPFPSTLSKPPPPPHTHTHLLNPLTVSQLPPLQPTLKALPKKLTWVTGVLVTHEIVTCRTGTHSIQRPFASFTRTGQTEVAATAILTGTRIDYCVGMCEDVCM